MPQLYDDARRSVLNEHLLCEELCHGVFARGARFWNRLCLTGWRRKTRVELAMLRPPPAPKTHKAASKRPRELDDDPWMDKATPAMDPAPVKLTSIFKELPPLQPLAVHVPLVAPDALTALADAEVASLTPRE